MQMKTNSIWMGAAIGFALLLLFATPQRAVAQWSTASNQTDVFKTNTTGNVGIGTASPGQPVEVKAASPAIRFNGTSAGAIYDIGILPNVGHATVQRVDTTNANTIFRIIPHGTGADYTGYGAGHLMGQWQIFGPSPDAESPRGARPPRRTIGRRGQPSEYRESVKAPRYRRPTRRNAT